MNIIELLNFSASPNGRIILGFDAVNPIKSILISCLSSLKVVLGYMKQNIW